MDRSEGTHLALVEDTCRHDEATPPSPIRWDIYKLALSQTWVGEVRASDEREAIEIVAEEFGLPASNLMAIRR